MNDELVDQLAWDAGCLKTTIHDPVLPEGNGFIISQATLDKFAELIVKECAKFLKENSGYDAANNAWHPEPEDLLKHFGVE